MCLSPLSPTQCWKFHFWPSFNIEQEERYRTTNTYTSIHLLLTYLETFSFPWSSFRKCSNSPGKSNGYNHHSVRERQKFFLWSVGEFRPLKGWPPPPPLVSGPPNFCEKIRNLRFSKTYTKRVQMESIPTRLSSKLL